MEKNELEVKVTGALARDLALKEEAALRAAGNPYHGKGGRFTSGPGGGNGAGLGLPDVAPSSWSDLKAKAKEVGGKVKAQAKETGHAISEQAQETAGAVGEAAHSAAASLKQWKAEDFDLGGDEGSFTKKVEDVLNHVDDAITGDKLKGLIEKAKPDKELLVKFHNNVELAGLYTKGFYAYTKDHQDEVSNFIADNGDDMAGVLRGIGVVTGLIGAHVTPVHPPLGASIVAAAGVAGGLSLAMGYATRAAAVNQARLGGEPGAASIKLHVISQLAAKNGVSEESVVEGSDLNLNANEKKAVVASSALFNLNALSDYDRGVYSVWTNRMGLKDAGAEEWKTVLANRVNELFMIVEDSAGEVLVPRFVKFELEPAPVGVVSAGNPNHGANGRFTSGPGGKGGVSLPQVEPIGPFGTGFSWKTAVGVTKVKQTIARKTHIPTTKAGRERKINKIIVHNEGKIMAGSAIAGGVAVGAAAAVVGIAGLAGLHAVQEARVNQLKGKIKEAEKARDSAVEGQKNEHAAAVEQHKADLAAAEASLKEAKAKSEAAAKVRAEGPPPNKERLPGEKFTDYIKRLGKE